MESNMLFILLVLCVGLAPDTEAQGLSTLDAKPVIPVIVSQVQCFSMGVGPTQSQPSILYSFVFPSPLELSRLLYPLEGRDVEWLSGSQILDARSSEWFLSLIPIPQLKRGFWYEIAFASTIDDQDPKNNERLGALKAMLERHLVDVTTAYYK